MEKNSNSVIFEMFSIVMFIGSYFLLHIFDLQEATNFLLASMVGGITYFVMAADFKEEVKDGVDTRRLNFYIGLITLFIFVNLGNGIIHWYRLTSNTVRNILMFILILIFIIILIRAHRALTGLKTMYQAKKK